MQTITEREIINKIILKDILNKAKEKEVRVSKNFVATNRILQASEIRRLVRERKSIAYVSNGHKEINSAAFYNSMRFNTLMSRIENGNLYYTKKISNY